MKAIKLLVAGACALGFFASALADGEVGKAPWFAENATSVSTALSGGGSTPSGTWSNLADQVQVKENVIEVDADDEQAVAYAPTAELTANASSVTLSNVVFVAARKTLPAIEAGTQAAVAVTTNEAGSCVFAVAVAGAWVVTETPADPKVAYTIRCDFTYGETPTINYVLLDGETETALLDAPAVHSATEKVTTVKLAGSGSFTAVGGVYPVATIDFGMTLPEGVASVTVNGGAPVDGKVTLPAGTQAVVEFTAAYGWSVDPTTITLPSVTANVDYKGENFPATVTKIDGWALVSVEGAQTNSFETLSEALAALEDGETLMPLLPGEEDLSVLPTTFTKVNLNAVPVDCPFIVTNNDVTVDFRGRVIKDAFAPAVVPEEADGRPYLVMVTEGATNVTIRNGFLFGSGYDVSSSEPKDSDRRLIGVKHAEAEVENCVMFGPGVSGILRVGQDASLVVRNSWFDGQGDGCQDVVLVSDGSELVFANVKGFWNPEDFWGTEDGVNGSFTEITGEQFAIVNGSTLTLSNTVISNNVTQWIQELSVSAVVARGEGNKLDLDGTSEVWMGGGVPAVSADCELVIDGAGKVTGGVVGDGVVFQGGSYTFNPGSRVADGYIAIPDGDRWTVVPATRWMVESATGTSVYSTLSDALAALNDGDTLMPEAPGDGTISENHPTAFDKDNLRPVSVDCPFIVTNNDVTVDFRGRVLRDAVAVADERPFLIWVEGADGVKIQNGFFFGTTWRAEYELSPTDYRGFRISDRSSVSVEGCAVFIAATTNSVNVLDQSVLAFSGCWIDGQGDGAERVFHAAGDSTITIKDTKGLWNPENFWGITDGVEASLPAITGEQFTLEASSLYLDNTIISNTVTHWSEGGKVATPVTFSDVANALSLANGASITATTGNVAVAKIALSEVGVKLYSDAEFAPNDEIVGGADGVKVGKYQPVGSPWKWSYLAEEAPSDPLPPPDEVPTDADVVKVMADAAPSLKAQIKTVNDYTNFYAWVESASLDHATAKRSKDAFFSFATAQAKLVDTVAVSNGAVRIISMATSALGTAAAPTNVIGVAVEIKGVRVGDAAQSKYLERVFGAAGATDPAGPFSAGTVSLATDREGNAMTPMWGCVIFYAIPNMYLMKQPTGMIIMPGQGEETSETPTADQFFLRATVNPNPPPPGQSDPFIPSDPQAAMKEHCEEDPGLDKARYYPYEG